MPLTIGHAHQNPDFVREEYPHDTAALRAALEHCAQAKIPELRLCFAEDWQIGHEGASLVIASDLVLDAQDSLLTLVPYAGSSPNPVGWRNTEEARQITIRNLRGDGNAEAMAGEAKQGGCFWSFAGVDVTLENVHVRNCVRYNSFVATRSGANLAGTLSLTTDSSLVRGQDTRFANQLQVGQRIRTAAGALTFPVAKIVSDTELVLAYNFVDASEPESRGCAVVRGVRVEARDCSFGPTLRDDKFGGGGWDRSLFERCEFFGSPDTAGYGFGATGMYASRLEECVGRGVGSGFGLERAAGCTFVRCLAFENRSKGWSIVNGCQDNEFVECEAYENADGFYDATFSKTHGQNANNRYVRARARDNARHGMYFGGSLDPELRGCVLEANHQDPATHAVGRNLVCKALAGYPASQPLIDPETSIAADT